ncbi:uncharacterized protein LOC131952168 [Physella acuta]|uniref:uncharacterized protein LOC131952168 n=1 Tax=Physella acuta TaxID=109671 RepID=UPI0027DB090E|nr:uncharacterized protein LOC131952168 [Physella acuta]
MAYLNAVNLHALPVNNQSRSPEPASVVFCHGPEWTWRYQRNQKQDRLDNRFMYQDQGPPMYRLLGPPLHGAFFAPRRRTSTRRRNRSISSRLLMFTPVTKTGTRSSHPAPHPPRRLCLTVSDLALGETFGRPRLTWPIREVTVTWPGTSTVTYLVRHLRHRSTGSCSLPGVYSISF